MDPGKRISLEDYCTRLKAGDRTIYYFSAPSHHLAESSPYMEAVKKKDVEVLFCYEPYDELVLMNLAQFDKKNFKSIESELVDDKSDTDTVTKAEGSLTQEEADDLLGWLQVTLGNRIQKAKITNRLESHPCIVTVTEMGAARHFLRTTMADKSEEERLRVLQATLEINPKHPIITKLYHIKSNDADLARLVAEQIYDNAMIAAGLIHDPKIMLNRMNELLTKALEKH